jgi:hypothetical protein
VALRPSLTFDREMVPLPRLVTMWEDDTLLLGVVLSSRYGTPIIDATVVVEPVGDHPRLERFLWRHFAGRPGRGLFR